MSIVNIADTPPAHKPVPVFGSAIELAHGLIREWIDENKLLRDKCDLASLIKVVGFLSVLNVAPTK